MGHKKRNGRRDGQREGEEEGESWTAKSADDVTEMLLNFALLWVSSNDRLRRVLADLYFGCFSFIKLRWEMAILNNMREKAKVFSYSHNHLDLRNWNIVVVTKLV